MSGGPLCWYSTVIIHICGTAVFLQYCTNIKTTEDCNTILTDCIYLCGRDSSVGIATRHGLDGPGIESRWGRDFPHPSRPALGPTQPPVQ